MDLIDQRYKIVKTLGSGLSGEVLAVADKDGRRAALKFLKKVQMGVTKEDALANFKNEFSILAELNHPGIARILDFGIDTRLGRYYFTTDLIEGADFFAAAENQSPEVIEDMAVQVLRALNYLHSRGIFHLDIKPQNILVQNVEGKPRARIIDFGLAGFSAPRKRVGTPAYMAPEVILGGALDGRTDLYSFGVLLYKALTRQNPFATKNLQETLQRQKEFVPEPPTKILAGLPTFWDQILGRLLEKKPSSRYMNGAAVIRDINFLAGKNYEIETMDTRLSYIPEKGALIGRHKEIEIFESMFDIIFKQETKNPSRLLILTGKNGTGKSRLLYEFKYYSQLKDIPVHEWLAVHGDNAPTPPFCLHIDEADQAEPDQVNGILQKYAGAKIFVLWVTEKAPAGWTDCEVVQLKNYSPGELTDYLTMVTGLDDPPKKLVEEIFNRTDGNPLFVSEFLKSMLAGNLLLDASGRWARAAFEDMGIDFGSLHIPKTLSGLLLEKYHALDPAEKKILEWLAVFNRPLSIKDLQVLTLCPHPQSQLLNLTKEDLIHRTNREHHYFFTNILMRTMIYDSLAAETRATMHDQCAQRLETALSTQEEFLFHLGHGSLVDRAVDALEALGERYLEQEQTAEAIATFEAALKRAEELGLKRQLEVRTLLAEATTRARKFKEALGHYEALRKNLDSDPQKSQNLASRFHLYEKIGDLHIKMEHYQEARAVFATMQSWIRDVPNSRARLMVVANHLAKIESSLGNLSEAENIFRTNLKIWETEFGPEEKKLVKNNWLADVLILKKDDVGALEHLEKMSHFYQGLGDPFLLARTLYEKGHVLANRLIVVDGAEKFRTKELAIAAFEKCLKIAKEIPDRDLMLRTYNEIGNLYFYTGDLTHASEYYDRALDLARKREDLQTAAAIALNLASLYREQKAYRDSYPFYIYAINTLENLTQKTPHNIWHLFTSYTEITDAFIQIGELSKAHDSLAKAQKLWQDFDHLKAYEFDIRMTWAKYYHAAGHPKEGQIDLAKAKNLAKTELEKKELKEFQEEMQKQDGSDKKIPTPIPSRNIKMMTTQNADKSPVAEYENILQINKFLNSEHDPDYLLKMVLNYALDLTGAESGLVLLTNDAGELEVKAAVNIVVDAELRRISKSVAQKALETGEVVVSNDALTDGRFDSSDSIVLNELKSILCVPLKSLNKLVGVLYLDNRIKTDAFSNVNLRVLHAYCDQVGLALENARLIFSHRQLQKQLEEKLEKTTGELNEVKEKLQHETSQYMTKYSYAHIVAGSRPMQDIFKILDKITETNLAIFIHGASGTGKELFARAIHYNNPARKEKRFVAINCGAIPANLIESELFGHKAGSFTGADRDKKGLFEEAHGGTIFLDEIAELELALQVKLLRVLQEGEVQRVGDVRTTKVDVRVVSASHKSLDELIKKGLFREDLFYRLCQIKIEIPPLAARKEDIPLLAQHFIEQFRKDNNVKEVIKLAPQLQKMFFQYDWPGNVRELENVIKVACALREGHYIDVSSLPPNYGITNAVSTSGIYTAEASLSAIAIDEKNKLDPNKTWEEYETVIIAKSFAANHFKKGQTADMLGISPSTLYKKINEHHLEDKENPIYQDPFTYQNGATLKNYIPKVFKAALEHSGGHPYAAIRKLGVSQGYFYKVMKQFDEESTGHP